MVINYGATKREGGGSSEVLPLQKGGTEKVLAILKVVGGGGGCTKSFRVVLTRVLEVLTILEGGTTAFHPLKRGGGEA